MSDYLSRIAARNLNMAEVVQPRMWSLFEPPPSDGGQVFDGHLDRGEGDEVFVSDETEAYPQTSISPSSPILSDRSADSAPPEEGRTEKACRKAADPQTPIQKKPRPDLGEAREGPILETTENIPVAISRPNLEMAPAVQNLSNYSAAVNAEAQRTVRRKAAETPPPTSETIPSQLQPYPNKTERISATLNSETRRIDSQSPSQKAPEQETADQRQTAPPAVTVKTEPPRTVRRKTAETPPLTSETIPSQLLPYPHKTETIPATANGETQKIDSQASSQKAPEQETADQRQNAPPAMIVKTETVRRKAADSQPPTPEMVVSSSRLDLIETKSRQYPKKMGAIPATANNDTQKIDSPSSVQKVPKQTPPDQRHAAPPAVTIKTETVGTVRRKAAFDQPLVPGSIPDRPRQEPGEVKRRLDPEMAETTRVTVKSDIKPPDLRQQEPPVAAAGFETARRSRQKVADLQPRPSEPIQSRSRSDLEMRRRQPGPEKAPYLEVTAERHPSSIETKPPSGREIDRSPKVGIDGVLRTVSGRAATEKELLLAPSSRAESILPPETTRFVAPTDSIKNQPTETNPTIQVKIGRVEVHALATASPPSRGAPQPAPKLSLDEYLKLRNGGRP